ncbi:reverse transcriptase [Lithospermum erythrorhizon]|uniref:Reverse transcriptase n=1 Tax=Lithospermum erythrorhizon TaxID=34254 RepID=A0AAV3PIZ0_LITER
MGSESSNIVGRSHKHLGENSNTVEGKSVESYVEAAQGKVREYWRMDLAYIQPMRVDDKPMVDLPPSVIMAGVELWKHTSIRYVLGYNPTFGEMEKFLHSLRKAERVHQISHSQECPIGTYGEVECTTNYGRELYEVISYIFATGEILAKVNATTIALIPKTTNPRTVAEFRPIACCNNLYKCVTKNLIGDNIHMLQELVQGYRKEDGNSRAALKIDLKKAYDTIEWGALWCVMEDMKFPPRFIYLVQQCVEGANFLICINGTLKGWFRSSRGVRQGDPMSLYLFLMVLEDLEITHLSFADDMILLSSANASNFKAIKEVLEEFGELTGLQLNCQKSKIYFGSTKQEVKTQIRKLMGMEEDSLLMTYLGIPLSSRKLGKEDYSKLIAKICNSISNWQARHLSLAGIALLIRTSIFGLQNFWCSQVPIPKYVIEEVESRIRSFLWSGKEGGRSIAKVSWNTICLPLKGGLGFKNMQKESLWMKWVHIIRLKGVSIWAYKKKESDPWLWKKVL